MFQLCFKNFKSLKLIILKLSIIKELLLLFRYITIIVDMFFFHFFKDFLYIY